MFLLEFCNHRLDRHRFSRTEEGFEKRSSERCLQSCRSTRPLPILACRRKSVESLGNSPDKTLILILIIVIKKHTLKRKNNR